MVGAGSCLSFAIDCGVLFKGLGVAVMGAILFIGSVYLMLSAVFGRWMGYLVTMVALSGWLILLSSIWLFGLFSQGPGTQSNLGPRGQEPAWHVLAAGERPGTGQERGQGTGQGTEKYEDTFRSYPSVPWYEPRGTATELAKRNPKLSSAVLSASSAATTFLAEKANEELERAETAADAIAGTQFTVDSVRFATTGDDTPLSVVEAHFTGGGPRVVLSLYHDSGSVPRYSFMILAGSIILFAGHVPLLDRAERKRKEFLTGGTAPAWYGPA